ncbi:MAG TPA: FHA domain-containing protein [Thermoanaerobaculia bacterium]|nr:FHA domain-containing protein [Thermoanaerobaculia bacterium]
MAKLADLVDKIRRYLGRPWEYGTAPMEIRRAVLEEVEGRVVAAGGDLRIFPFDRVTVRLLAADPEERALLEAVARDGWRLEEEIPARLRALGAQVPPGLTVEVEAIERSPGPGGRRFAVSYGRTEAASPPAPSAAPAPTPPTTGGDEPRRPELTLTVLKGRASPQVLTAGGDRVYVGRLREVIDEDGKVKRRNDVAFLEEGEESATVSREHARIAWDAASGGYWLRDEGSAFGTRIFRDGRPIEVASNDRRGVRLRGGDEVYFGRTAVKVAIRPTGEAG